MNTKHKDAQLRQGIWLAAMKHGTVRVELGSPQAAAQFRFSMYKAVRPVRDGKVINQPLMDAINDCTLTIEGSAFVCTRSDMTPQHRTIREQLGSLLEDLQPEDHLEHAESSASLDRLRALLDEGTPKAPDTPDIPSVSPSVSGPAGKRNPYY